MGYFANGTEGDIFEERYCSRCVHNSDKGCPVMLAHLLYAYELCNEEKHPGKVMLDLLIPRDGPWNAQCAMFHEKQECSCSACVQAAEARLAQGSHR